MIAPAKPESSQDGPPPQDVVIDVECEVDPGDQEPSPHEPEENHSKPKPTEIVIALLVGILVVGGGIYMYFARFRSKKPKFQSVKFFWSRSPLTENKDMCADRTCVPSNCVTCNGEGQLPLDGAKSVCQPCLGSGQKCTKWHLVQGIYTDESETSFVHTNSSNETLLYTGASGISTSCELADRAKDRKKWDDSLNRVKKKFYDLTTNQKYLKRGWIPENYKPRSTEVPWKITYSKFRNYGGYEVANKMLFLRPENDTTESRDRLKDTLIKLMGLTIHQ